jgi:DNA repair protein RecN (Recombination protein N)
MIQELRVDDLAIIRHVELPFHMGFSVLTGETGAGKSLMIDALELALGERADTELVRTGATKASVQLVLDITQRPDLVMRLEVLGVAPEDGQIYIHREVHAEGRSQARINGRTFPVSVLKSIGKLIVDLHGQHQHQSLLDPESHVNYLDDWIGEDLKSHLEDAQTRFGEWNDAKRAFESLRKGLREREQRLDMLRFQVKEIEEFGVLPGEEEVLMNELSRLKNAERITLAVKSALSALSDEETNARDLLATGVKAASDITRFDSSLSESLHGLEAALVTVEESIHTIREYGDRLEVDPTLLDAKADRLESLRRLKRKYGESEAEILEFLAKAQGELSLLEDSGASEEMLVAKVQQTESSLRATCEKISTVRKSKAKSFTGEVRQHLADLSMSKALFEVSVQQTELGPNGYDLIEFMFSANAGEEIKPLAKIASGGEISRVMLALKSALAGRAGVPTLIFDEVDTGLGGKAAAAVGRKLQQLGEFYQVIAISHLPQVASMASQHYRIEKSEEQGRVNTTVKQLQSNERVEEIARMLAGESVTDTSLANARELLQLL